MKIIRILLPVSLLVLITGCAGPKQPDVSNEEMLAAMPGPEIKGYDATLDSNAKAAMDRGDYKKAGELYRQLIEKNGGNATYLLGYADAARRAGRYDSAIVSYSELVKLDPNNIDAKEGLGLTQLGQEKFGESGQTLTEVLKADPKRWRTLNALGLLFVRKSMYDGAMAYFTEALRQSPNNVSVLNNVGLSQAMQRDFGAATQSLQKASDLAPAGSGLRSQIDLNLAMVYGVAGDMTTAEQIASRYLKGAALDNNLGLYSYLAADDRMAKDYLNMALSESPRYYDRAWKNLHAISGGSSTADAATADERAVGTGKRIKIQ